MMEAGVTRRYIAPMRCATRLITAICAAFAFAGHAGVAAQAVGAAAGVSPAPLVQIEPGDQVRIEVFGNPDLTTVTYVTDDGAIRMAMAGAVPVSDRSPAEAAQRIEAALKAGEFLVDPHVTVTVLQSFRQRVTVAGEVRTPGRYPIEPNSTVLDAIALAGGLTEKGSDSVYLLRRDASGVQQRVQVQVNTRDILDSRDANSAAMQILKGDDSIIVPKATFTITGEVKQSGEFRIESGMTLLQAIARAGGVTPLGSDSRVEIQRRGADGKFTDVKGKKDMLIQPGDMIRVKERLF